MLAGKEGDAKTQSAENGFFNVERIAAVAVFGDPLEDEPVVGQSFWSQSRQALRPEQGSQRGFVQIRGDSAALSRSMEIALLAEITNYAQGMRTFDPIEEDDFAVTVDPQINAFPGAALQLAEDFTANFGHATAADKLACQFKNRNACCIAARTGTTDVTEISPGPQQAMGGTFGKSGLCGKSLERKSVRSIGESFQNPGCLLNDFN